MEEASKSTYYRLGVVKNKNTDCLKKIKIETAQPTAPPVSPKVDTKQGKGLERIY